MKTLLASLSAAADSVDSGAHDIAIASALIVLCAVLIVRLIEGDKT